MNINEKRVLFVDLDGTLIHPIVGKPFPQGVWDMTLDIEVMMKIAELKPTAVFIVSNQGGIERGDVQERLFEHKFLYVISALQDMCGQHVFVAGRYCPTLREDSPMRKPNTGMLSAMQEEFEKMLQHEFAKEDCVMIGDMETDRATAENYQIDYIDVADFKRCSIDEARYRIVDAVSGADIPDQPLLHLQEAKTVIDGLNKEGKGHRYAMVSEKFILPPKPTLNRQQRRKEEKRRKAS